MDPMVAELLRRPSEMPTLIAVVVLVWSFWVAAAWGSFLNVVIARVPAGESVVRPRSRCPGCKTQISARDNVPIVSWLLLRGRCRTCKTTISWRYPFVELLVGLGGAAIVARFGFSVAGLEHFIFFCLLTAIAFIDLDTFTIPNSLWGGLLVTGLAFAGLQASLADDGWVLWDRVIGGFAAGAILAAVVVFSTGVLRRTGRLGPDEWAMGWGDPLMIAGIGAYLGWQLMPLVLFLASLQGAIVGLIARARGGLQGDEPVSETDDWVPPKNAVPFGPFLALAALEAAFFGDGMLARLLPTLHL